MSDEAVWWCPGCGAWEPRAQPEELPHQDMAMPINWRSHPQAEVRRAYEAGTAELATLRDRHHRERVALRAEIERLFEKGQMYYVAKCSLLGILEWFDAEGNR